MTYNAPILWSEGMPLHPHHFQASDRNILNDNREQAKHLPYNWGLAAQIDYDYDLLQGYTPLFRIKHARLRLEDGTWINIPDNAAVNDTQISEETLQNREILVFLGIKQLDQDEPVVKEKETDNTEKSFIAKEMDFLGETPNTQSKKVRVKLWQTKISFSHPPTDEENKQYEWIVIGRILSDGIQMTFNKQYIPPILNVCASDVLMNQISNIVKYMQSNINAVQQRVISFRSKNVDLNYAQLDDILRLQIYVSYARILDELLKPKAKIHPFQMYIELCHLAGALQAISPDIPMKVLPYDHNNLTEVMPRLIKTIMELLKRILTPDFLSNSFQGEERFRTCKVDSKDIDFNAPMYICVISNNNQTSVDNDFLHSKVKIAPTQVIKEKVKRGDIGIEFKRITPAPEGLNKDQSYHYFEPVQPISHQSDYLDMLRNKFSLTIYNISYQLYPKIELYTKKIFRKQDKK
jgi:type VI secretion system ImpJ/VasE family protein